MVCTQIVLSESGELGVPEIPDEGVPEFEIPLIAYGLIGVIGVILLIVIMKR